MIERILIFLNEELFCSKKSVLQELPALTSSSISKDSVPGDLIHILRYLCREHDFVVCEPYFLLGILF